jgi:hypothetical protein
LISSFKKAMNPMMLKRSNICAFLKQGDTSTQL